MTVISQQPLDANTRMLSDCTHLVKAVGQLFTLERLSVGTEKPVCGFQPVRCDTLAIAYFLQIPLWDVALESKVLMLLATKLHNCEGPRGTIGALSVENIKITECKIDDCCPYSFGNHLVCSKYAFCCDRNLKGILVNGCDFLQVVELRSGRFFYMQATDVDTYGRKVSAVHAQRVSQK